MKRILAIMIVIAMVMAVTACTTTPPATSNAPSTPAATPAPTKTPGVLENKLVRQALSLAIDRDYINKTLFNGSRVPAYAVASPGVPDATPGSDFRATGGAKLGSYWGADHAADVAKAKELLKQAGYPNGEGFPVLEVSFNTGTGNQKVSEILQAQWKETLGINVKIASMEWNTFQTYRKTAQCQIARQGWLGDYTDPATFFDLFTSDAGTNDGHYNNPEYDKLVIAARTEQDPAKRMQMYHDAEKIIMEDAGILPIYFYADDVLSQVEFPPYDVKTGVGYQQVATGLKQFHNTTKTEATVCVGPEPATLDPNLNESVDGMIYINALYEGFYRQELDGKFSIAQAKTFKNEGNIYTVTLRDDVFWSDGKPVTAQDYEYSWKRLADPATASSYGYIVELFLKNGYDVTHEKVPASELSCKAIDDKTFQFEVAAPCNYIIDLMAFPSLMPLRKDIVEKNPEGWSTDPATMVYNGRYVLQSWNHEAELVLAKNDKYWDKDSTKTTKVTYKLMSDDNAILAAFKAKTLDMCDTFPAGELTTLEKTPEFHRFGNVGLYYYQLQQLQP